MSAPGKTHHRRSSPFRSPLPLSLAQRETAFHDVHTKIATPLFDDRPRSVRSLPPPSRDDVFLSSFWPQPSLLSAPISSQTPEPCITDSSKLLPLIALTTETQWSPVLPFLRAAVAADAASYLNRFLYAMSIYTPAMSSIAVRRKAVAQLRHFSVFSRD